MEIRDSLIKYLFYILHVRLQLHKLEIHVPVHDESNASLEPLSDLNIYVMLQTLKRAT